MHITNNIAYNVIHLFSTPQAKKKSPWSSASKKGIDSLADWLIPTLGRPDDFTFFYLHRLVSLFICKFMYML